MHTFRVQDSQRLAQIYSPKAVSTASTRAIRDATKVGRTQLSKFVRQEYNVRASLVKDKSSIFVDRGTRATATLVYRDFRGNLGRFESSSTLNGRTWKVRVKVRKRRGTKTVKKGFKIPAINRQLIWKRLTDREKALPKYAGRKSKIKVLRSISVPEMVNRVNKDKRVQATIQSNYEKRFNFHFQKQIGLL